MKIGIYGGAFAPLHNGHVSAAMSAYDALRLDLLYVIPTKTPPHKDIASDRADCRYSMAQAVFGDPGIIGERDIAISPIEFERSAPSYTSDTLREIRAEVGGRGCELYLIVGGDSFLALEDWHEGGEILRSANIAVVGRHSDAAEAAKIEERAVYYDKTYGANIYIIDAPIIEISSTELREKIAAGEDFLSLVPTAVAREIAYERLWGDVSISSLRDLIRPYYGEKRYKHVVSTADECVRIAKALRLPAREVDRVYVAGLLHDLTRTYGVKEHKKLAKECGVKLPPDDLDTPNVLHQTTGALLAERLFPALCDKVVLGAVACHTTGKPDMNVSEMILFLADYIEPTREHKACKKARKRFWSAASTGFIIKTPNPERAMESLKTEVRRTLIKTAEHLTEKGEPVNIRTREAIDAPQAR